MNGFSFSIQNLDKKTKARIGTIHTPHGDIETPAFVPVGTQATVKSLTPEDLQQLDTHLFFVNTYHAYLRPGTDVMKLFGGLHTFMHWDRPLITDSGGFQIFSLGKKRYINIAISESAVGDREKFTKKLTKGEAKEKHVFPDDYRPVGELVKIDEDGVTFTSHWDGSSHRFTPEVSMDIQWDLGSDIHIAFDECAPYPTPREYAEKAMIRTHRWAVRSLDRHVKLRTSRKPASAPAGGQKTLYQALYGVIQGSVYEDLRRESAKYISSLPFDGFAIGGVSVGESKIEMQNVLSWVMPHLPADKPRHLLGVGEIDDIFALVEYGVDTFDCVQPTRLARMGIVYIYSKDKKHEMTISKSKYSKDTSPIDEKCGCYTCKNYSRSYLHHLFRVRELLGYRLATIHNIAFVNRLVEEIRKSIKAGTFSELKSHWV